MSILERLFKFQRNPALSISDYAAIGPVDGGAPWGIADPNTRAIQIAQTKKIVNLSAAYTVTILDSNTLFTVDTAITVTLPAVSAALTGVFVDIIIIADVTVVVAATANQMITFNDVDADSLTWSTSSEKIGASLRATCNGSFWLIQLMTEETQTTTVTT